MTPEQRRALHPEVDWRQPITLMFVDVHPRGTGRCYATEQAALCQCGCPTTTHDMDSGECRRCGCEMLWVAS